LTGQVGHMTPVCLIDVVSSVSFPTYTVTVQPYQRQICHNNRLHYCEITFKELRSNRNIQYSCSIDLLSITRTYLKSSFQRYYQEYSFHFLTFIRDKKVVSSHEESHVILPQPS
jgi:hypothetical protein